MLVFPQRKDGCRTPGLLGGVGLWSIYQGAKGWPSRPPRVNVIDQVAQLLGGKLGREGASWGAVRGQAGPRPEAWAGRGEAERP